MTNKTKFLSNRIIRRLGAPLVILALMLSGLWATSVRAATLVDPDVEDSTTHFGQSLAVIGDVTGDGIPDILVGGPFHDSHFAVSNGFGPPQDCGRAFIINGATLTEVAELN